MLRGTKDNGMKMRNEISFHAVVDIEGIRALRESANRTTRATLLLAYIDGTRFLTMSQ